MHVLPGQNYDCLHCGKSCSQDWLVPVDPAVEARLGHAVMYDPPTGLKRVQAKDGVCVLRTDRCSVYGHAPKGCRQFPYMPVETPDGVFLGVSFFCTAVQQNHGAPLRMPEGLIVPRLEGPFTLYGEATLAWQDYLLLEDVPVERALWAAAELSGIAPPGEIPREYLEMALGKARPEQLAQDEALVGMTDFFALNLLVWLQARQPGPQAVQALMADEPADFKCGFTGRLSELVPQPCDELLERYRKALVFRKMLLQRRPILENLVLLHLIGTLLPLLSGLGPGAVDLLERDLVTHALDVPAHRLLPAFAQAYVEQVSATTA